MSQVARPSSAHLRSGLVTPPRTSSRHTPANSIGDARPSSSHSRRNRSRAQSGASPPPPLPLTKDGDLDGGPPADVMVDLLASFNSISHIKPSRKTTAASAPSPPPFRRSRPGTASAASPPGASDQHFSAQPADDAAIPSPIQRAQYQHAPLTPSPSQIPQNFPPPPPIPNDEYDPAEPPTIRTSRRSPAHSKQNSFSQAPPARPKTASSASPGHFLSSFSRSEQSPQTPTDNASVRSGFATPQERDIKSSSGRSGGSGFLRSLSRRRAKTDPRNPSALSQPASIRGFSAHGSAYTSRPQSPTGEAPEVPLKSSARMAKSVPSSHYHTPRRQSPTPPLPTTEPVRTRKMSLSRRLFSNDTPKTPTNGESRSRKASISQETPPMPTSAPPTIPSRDGRPTVPDRGSSLPKKPFSGLQRLKDPLASMRRSSNKHGDAKDSPSQSQSKSQSQSPSQMFKGKSRENEKVANDDDQESDVFRRIRELKEASERRRRENAELAASDLSGPPKTVTANGQLLAASKLQEQRLDLHKSNTNGSTGNADTDSPILVTPDKESFANGRATTKSAGQSRSNSRSRTQQGTDLAPPSRGHKKTNSRGGFSIGGASSHHDIDEESIREEVQAYLETPRLSQKIRSTRDTARIISFSEVGDPRGHPVLCCIGMGLTRYVMAFYDELATSLRLRLITPERPGIGDTSPFADGISYPLQWPDDVQDIIEHLSVSKYTLLAHSAGAIYGLAAALSYPELLRCPIHLLAPWIPPSQMVSPPTAHSKAAASKSPQVPVAVLPRSQRLLRLLPTPFFKLTTVGSVAGAAANGTTTPRTPRKSTDSPRASMARGEGGSSMRLFFSPKPSGRVSPTNLYPLDEVPVPDDHAMADDVLSAGQVKTNGIEDEQQAMQARERHYNEHLTTGIWDLSTRNSNPSLDLLICLERSRRIGFNYADIRHPVIIHHGSKDARVPLENVRWLATAMPEAELRVLDGQSHSLMSSAGVMGAVLSEISKQCETESRRERIEAINATIKSVPVPAPHAVDLETVDEEGAEFTTPPSGTTP